MNNVRTRPYSSSDTQECVKVIVRCRPLLQSEADQGHHSITEIDSELGTINVTNPKDPGLPKRCFTFDAVYGPSSKQMDLYDETFRELVDSVLQGFNGTIFAYGQTGTGKTFTMEGIKNGNSELRGVIPNAIDHIFRYITESPSQSDSQRTYLVRASYLEIYQEDIRDLLDLNSSKRLELKERPDIGVYVNGLSSFVTKSVEEIEHLMSIGHANRSVGRTNMNEYSSRSHAIFIITIECSELGPDNKDHIKVGRLNLVDLAGSERQIKTGTEGERFRESTRINLSLSALGNVISALSGAKSSHVPYRDSKLTRLLQDSLGGNSKTIMIANIGPASFNFEETINTLRYSSRATQIKNRPHINEDPKDALLREFQEEIARLKGLLETRSTGSNCSNSHLKQKRRHESPRKGDEQFNVPNGEAYIQTQRAKLQEEKDKLTRNGEIIEEEKERILSELEDREKRLEEEREVQLNIASKIAAMQSKLLTGHGNLLNQTRKQQELLQQKRIELAAQRRKEREIARQVDAHEESTTEIRQTFTNLQQEVDSKQRRLQKFAQRFQQNRCELCDIQETNSNERQTLEVSLLEMNKELKLKWLIAQNFIPLSIVNELKQRAFYDEDKHKWILYSETTEELENKLNENMFDLAGDEATAFRRNRASPEKLQQMVDSGLGSAAGTSDSSSTSQEDAQHLESQSRIEMPERQISLSGQRRPTTDFERISLSRLRQRCARFSPPSYIQCKSHSFDKIDCNVPDEVARFGCENLLTFNSLIFCPSNVRLSTEDNSEQTAFDENISQQSRTQQNLVVDTSKIPMLQRRRDSKSRDQSQSSQHSIRRISVSSSSSQPKNARARSMFGAGESKRIVTHSAYSSNVHQDNNLPQRKSSSRPTSRPPSAGGRIPIPIPIPMTPSKTSTQAIGLGTGTLIFPKARGLVTMAGRH